MTDIFLHERDSRRGRSVRVWPTGERVETRGVIASSLALGALVAGATAGGAVASGAIASRAQGKAAKQQSAAITESARIEDEAAKRAEAFARQVKQQEWIENERVSRANYDQWASRQRSLNAFRQKHGYGPTEIPGYVPSQDPGYGGGPPPEVSLPAGAPANMVPPKMRDPNRPTPMGAVDAYLPSQGTAFQPYGPGPSVPPMRVGPAKMDDAFGGGVMMPGGDNLPPGVPPGSVPINAGINPDLWAYQTPDGRIVRGTRKSQRPSLMSVDGYLPRTG